MIIICLSIKFFFFFFFFFPISNVQNLCHTVVESQKQTRVQNPTKGKEKGKPESNTTSISLKNNEN